MAPGPRGQPPIRLPMGRLATALLVACAAVTGIGAGAAVGDQVRTSSALAAGGVVAVATLGGLAFLAAFGARPAFSWGPITVAAGAIRMAGSVALAMALYVRHEPDKAFFWGVFLAASVAVLAAETATVRRGITLACAEAKAA